MAKNNKINNLPVLSGDVTLSNYLNEIKKFPMLSAEEESPLATRLNVHGDTEAAHQLVTSHLRLVAKLAMGYIGYGLPITDIISEGNVGLMQAVQKFDPEKGFRLATYALWWVKAAMQEYILRSWSLVKIGTTAVQKITPCTKSKQNCQIGSMTVRWLWRPPLKRPALCRLPKSAKQYIYEIHIISTKCHRKAVYSVRKGVVRN